MNVRPTPPNPYAAPVTEVIGARSGAAAQQGVPQGDAQLSAQVAPREDVVELSPAARLEAASAQRARAESPELEEARVALHAQPGLSAERMQTLKQKVASGYFDSPEAVSRVSTAITRGL